MMNVASVRALQSINSEKLINAVHELRKVQPQPER